MTALLLPPSFDLEARRPRFATLRDPACPTFGREAAHVATIGGLPPMPWQDELLDVALEWEVGDDGKARLRYRTVVVTVPRQNGKSAIARAVLGHRLLRFSAQTILGVALTHRNIAEETWGHVADLVERVTVPSGRRIRRANGQERISVLENGSRYMIAAATESAGHGFSVDLPFVDEAWDTEDDALVEQGLRPTMRARHLIAPGPQLWIVSSAGTAKSHLLRRYVDRGRAGDPGICYLEWSAPEDLDPADPVTWALANPALGHTVTLQALADDQANMPPSEWERAGLNRWTFALDHALPPEWWARARWDGTLEALEVGKVAGRVDLAAAMAEDRSAVSVVAAWTVGDHVALELVARATAGDPEVIAAGGLRAWSATALDALARRWRPTRWDKAHRGGIALEAAGPERTTVDDLARLRVPHWPMTAPEVAAAAGALYDALRDGTVVHLGQGALETAVQGAARRPLGDRWAFTRRGSTGDVSPVIAASLALYAHSTRPARPTVLVTHAE